MLVAALSGRNRTDRPTTVAAAVMVALNWSARVTVLGFAVFIAASLAWMIDGWLEAKASLLIQNAVLLLVNIAGVYRVAPTRRILRIT